MPLRRIITVLVVLAYASCCGQSEQSRDSLAILKRSLEEQRAVAKAAIREATRAWYLSQAKEASQKSLLVQDKETAALVGIQAFNFNRANGGNPFEPSVYSALLNASRKHSLKTRIGDSTTTWSKLLGTRGEKLFLINKSSQLVNLSPTTTGWSVESSLAVPGLSPSSLVAINQTGSIIACFNKQTSRVEYFSFSSKSNKPFRSTGVLSGVLQIEFIAGTANLLILHEGGKLLTVVPEAGNESIIKTKAPLTSFCVSEDGTMIAGVAAAEIWYWNSSSGKEVDHQVIEEGKISKVMFWPGGLDQRQRLLVCTDQGAWHIRTTASLLKPRPFLTYNSSITQAIFSKYGNIILFSYADGTIRAWDGTKVANQPIEIRIKTTINGIALTGVEKGFGFDSRGLSIVYLSESGGLNALPLDAKEMAEPLCKRVTRNMTLAEWDYFFTGLEYERTCDGSPANNK